MNNCHNCLDFFEKGINIYYNRQYRIFCSWRCVRVVAERAEMDERGWPPPIPNKMSIEQNKK